MTNPSDLVPSTAGRILSVGHSNHGPDAFLALLRGAGVTAVADVRSSPHSRWLPHFNGPELSAALDRAGIAYVYLGEQLGGRPSDPGLYDDEGRADYDAIRATGPFREGLERLIQGAERFVVAMTCAEEDPLDCHRGLMITPALLERGIAPGHLRRDGSIESTRDMERRLLTATGREELLTGLFAAQLSEGELREELAGAYRVLARKRAFRLSRD